MTRRLLLAVVLGGAAVGLLMWPGLAPMPTRRPGSRSACSPASVGRRHADPEAQRRRRARDGAHGWQLLITAVPITIGALVAGDGQWFRPELGLDRRDRLHRPGADGDRQRLLVAIVGMLPANVAGLSSILVPSWRCSRAR
jgi:hypothetical protein